MLRWLLRLILLVVVAIAFVLPKGDVRTFSASERAASEHIFSIPGWEIENFLDKWLERVAQVFTGGGTAGREAATERYFELLDRVTELRGERDRAAANPDTAPDELAVIEADLAELIRERRNLRNDTEEFLEATVSGMIRNIGIGGPGWWLWPPVDIRLEAPPYILVTSPRDRIERLNDVLLDPQINAIESELVEERLFSDADRAAAVMPLGGVATYPTFVRDDYDLRTTLNLTAHEWLHGYFFFESLGRNMGASTEMNILTETVASIAGNELGGFAYAAITGETVEPFKRRETKPERSEDSGDGDSEEFSFESFMRETRLKTDELLARGEIVEAEEYMEARRVQLQDHRYYIRVINQAYFAFHGTYGDSPSSISPIGDEVDEFRSLMPDIGEFISQVKGIGSYAEFEALLDAARGGSGPGDR